jgi:hypothetical protein
MRPYLRTGGGLLAAREGDCLIAERMDICDAI